jgi:CHAT domain-containing protein
MSLWKVPDDATSKMMQLFYQYWLVDKMDKYEAFRKAQMGTREIFPDVRCWAGFVMID